jgi:hypothetical protein
LGKKQSVLELLIPLFLLYHLLHDTLAPHLFLMPF